MLDSGRQLADGIFGLNDCLTVVPAMIERDFVASAPTAEPQIFNDPFHSYLLRGCQWNDRFVTVSAYFRDGIIWRLYLAKSGAVEDSWANWSKEAVREDKAEYDRWLLEMTGYSAPYIFSWGSILSATDWKGGFSSIIASFDTAVVPAG